MNKRKRAPGAGRKPLDPSGSDIVMIRLPPDLRRATDRLAKKHKRNRSDVIRSAIRHWVGRYQVRTLHTEALTCAIALLADRIEQRTGKKWIEDTVTGTALREQVDRLIYHFAPTPAEPAVVPPEADVVGLVLTMIEHTVPVKGVPAAVTFSDDRGLSEILRDLARPPPQGLGSGWRRNRDVWEGNWVK
jgi:Arc/MetJ-type ribon-helix-helix transcriptional regulator